MKNHKASLIVIYYFFTFSIIFSSSLAFNITKILSPHKQLQTLNSLLYKTKLADEINRRRTITILAVADSELSSLAGKSVDVIRNILSVHVILDYYDVEKLTKLGISSNTTTLTTLFQASGLAVGLQGFLNVSLINEGEIAFGSAAPGGTLTSKLVEPVVAQPYDISVLQITTPIHVPGIESAPPASPPQPVSVPPRVSPKPAPTHPPAAPRVSPKPAPAHPPMVPRVSPKPAPAHPPMAPRVPPKSAPAHPPTSPKKSPEAAPIDLAPAPTPSATAADPASDGPESSLAKPFFSAGPEPPLVDTSGGSGGFAGVVMAAVLGVVSFCLVA